MYDFLYPVNIDKTKDLSKVIYAKDGSFLYVTTNKTQKWRFLPDIKRVDPNFVKFLLAYEDKRFYSHSGVDFMALTRATKQLLTNGRVVSGASTITMQLAKLLKPKRRTVLAKIQEIIKAWQIELHYSKEEILQDYLTLTPYGGNIEGLVSASLHYFGKMPYSLTYAQIAMLVALPQSPEVNRPDRHPIRAKKARDKVLKEMLQKGLIDRDEYLRAVATKIAVKSYKMPRFAPHFSQRLLRKIGKKVDGKSGMHYTSVKVGREELKVHTTIDKVLQMQLEHWAKNVQKGLDRGVTFSLIVVENKSSSLLAYLGSGDIFGKSFPGFVDMANAIRSPGSTLKPFIYTLGFEQKQIEPQTIILDEQTKFGDYMPHNFDKRYNGEVTIAYALQNSLNIPAVKVLNRVGVDKFVDTITPLIGKIYLPKKQATLPIALGGVGVRLWQLANLYQNLANLGQSPKLHYIKQTNPKMIKLFSKESAIKTINILREITPPKGFIDLKNQIAYKTGTSYGFRDSWTIAFNKAYTVALWVGRPDGRTQIDKTGLNTAAPLAFEALTITQSLLKPKEAFYNEPISQQKPPKILQYFDKKQINSENKLNFIIPKENTKFQSATCKDVVVEFKLSNAKEPIYWYIDGKEFHYKTKAQIRLKAGAHKITVIDNTAQSVSRDIWVNSGDCD